MRKRRRPPVCWLFAAVVLAAGAPTALPQEPEKEPRGIRITAYDVTVLELEKPVVRVDAEGNKKRYTKAFVVRLKGSFGEPRAIPVDIFIGDWRVPEYGGTKDGIYFRIYEEKVLDGLEGRPLGYGFQGQKVETFPLTFTPSALKPFKPEPARGIWISSYDIVVQEFEKPVVRVDAEGNKKRYTKAFVVRLKGSFGEPRAIPVDIFIGDWRVPEYGGTKDGIYFRIYEEKVLDGLEGRPLGYGFQGQKVETFPLTFTPKKLRPFKNLER